MDTREDKLQALRHGQKIAFMATGVTLMLAVLKGVIGYYFDSKILIADALHSGADLLAVFASGFGLWLAGRKKSRRFPYGLYRSETLASFLVGVVIVFAGIEIVKEGILKLFHSAPAQEFPLLPVVVSILSMITAYVIAKKEKSVGILINSQSLLANAKESFLDIITSFVVLVGIVLSYAHIPYIEGSIIILISVLILKLGIENIVSSLLILMDANLDPALQADIEQKINALYGVKGVSEVNIRQSGPFKMIECKIATTPTLSLYKAHALAENVEEYITKHYDHIESVFVHVEPLKETSLSAFIPVKDINGLASKVHGHFGRAPYFAILHVGNDGIDIEDFYANEFLEERQQIGLKVAKAIVRYGHDVLFTSRIGEISFYTLKNNFVDIFKVEEDMSLKNVIHCYQDNTLKEITAPTHPVEESQIGTVSNDTSS